MEAYKHPSEPNLPHRLLHGLGRVAIMVGKSLQYAGFGGIWLAPGSVKSHSGHSDTTPYESVCIPEPKKWSEPEPAFKTGIGFRQRQSKKDRLDLRMLEWDEVTLEWIQQYYPPEPLDLSLRDRCEIWLLKGQQIPFDVVDTIEHNDLGYKEQ